METQMPSADYQLVLTCHLMEKKEAMMSTSCAQSESSTPKIDSTEVQEFKKYAASLSVTDDCLINGNRVVIPEAMQPQSSVLASHRQPDRRYLQRMCVLCRTSEQTIEASQPPLDDS